MNIKKSYRLLLLMLSTACCLSFKMNAQDSTKKEERQSLLYLQYHVENNKIPFLYIQTKSKSEKGFLPVSNVGVTVYLDTDEAQDAMVGKAVTNAKGEAGLTLPASLSAKWNQQPTHSFYAHAQASPSFDATSKSINATIARLLLDTVNDGTTRSLIAKLEKKEGNSWTPMHDVDVKVGVKRLGGNLNVGDKDAYTTDSSGTATAEFLQQNLPGDQSGKLEAIAVVEDNDEVGTMQTSLTIPWGVPTQYQSEFGKRSLWATSRRAPVWLMLMAYGCIIAVWSVIIYLITRIVLIRKIGTSGTDS